VAVPTGVQLVPRHDAQLLNGVTVLDGQAWLVRSGEWSGRLYRTLRPQKTEMVNLRLIPYYAWANRGVSEMTVWMPVIR